MKTVIVGGVAGGASTAARLRRLDEHGEIIIFERGEYVSFANCGLPYYIGNVITKKEHLLLQTPESFDARFQVEVRILSEVTSIDPNNKTVTVHNLRTGEDYQESYDRLVLSPGAEPIIPGFVPSDSKRIFTLRTINDTLKIKDALQQQQVKSAVVIGGGYIGIEMVENLHKAGVDVTIIELADHIINAFDGDMASFLQQHLRSKGVQLRLQEKVLSLEESADKITVVTDKGSLDTDFVLLSVGVRPENKLAQEAGLKLTNNGCIAVDDHLETSTKDIYALGDAVAVQHFVSGQTTYIPLAGPANRMGRIVADNIAGINSTYQGTQGTSILKCFDLTAACTGLNEKALQASNYNYEKIYIEPASHATYYPGAQKVYLKLLFSKDTGLIFGAQLVGNDGIDKRCDVLATAIRAKMTVYDLIHLELCYAPPFSSAKDPVNVAGLVAENILAGRIDVFHYDLYPSLNPEEVTLLDVRTVKENEKGKIPNTINIPLDSLRSRLHELDPQKTIYVNCLGGLRSYVACRILTQHGFTCKNLSGGYLYWKTFTDEQKLLQNS